MSPFFRGCVSINHFIDESYLYKDPNSANFWIVYSAPPSTPLSSRSVAAANNTPNLGHFFMFACKNIVLSGVGEKILSILAVGIVIPMP